MLLFKRENLEGLDESLHGLYEQKDGAFFLKVQGAVGEDSVSGLKANHDALLAEKKEQQRLAQEAEAKRIEAERLAQEELARKSGNLEAIENSWKEKLALRESELSAQLTQAQQKNYELTVGRAAQEMAGRLAKPHAQRLLAKEIKERLTLDENGNIRVLDLQGNPSADDLVELESKLRIDPAYQDIIVINNSSGGGATGGNFGGGAAKKPSEMTEQERTELYRTDPAAYRQLFNIK